MRLDRVAVRYGFRAPWVLRDVTLDVPEGRLIRACGTVLAVTGGIFEWATSSPPPGPANPPLATIALDGSIAVLVGLLAGAALGALCAPPLLRRPASSVLVLVAASLALLAAPVSPVNVAIRDAFTSSSSTAATELPWWPLLACLALLTLAWSVVVRRAAGSTAD